MTHSKKTMSTPWSLLGTELHEITGNNSRAWYAWVETLTQAGVRVRNDSEARLPDGTELMLATNGVYAMLLGYAIECALKGLWVGAGNKLVEHGRYVRIKGAGNHQLGQLARVVGKAVGRPVSVEELNVLDRLSAFVLFAGRYPIPLNAEQMAPVNVPGRGKQVPHVFLGEDFRVAEALLNEFSTALNPFITRAKTE